MNIQWFGHSCFLLTTDSGVRVLMDPYGAAVGYPEHKVEADIVTSSHDHFDHNAVSMASGAPVVLKSAGVWDIKGVKVTGIKSFHDDAGGTLRGENILFLFEADEMRVAHMGDIGSLPDEKAIALLDPLDVVIVPIGGVFTIGPQLACTLANRTHARVLIPMHYQTPVLAFDKELHSVNDLITIAKDCSIHRLNQSECTITKGSLGEDRILVLDYAK